MKYFVHFFLIIELSLISGLVSATELNTNNSALLPTDQLSQKLKQGGYILYFRHAATDHPAYDQHPVDFTNCATQRNLSEQGINQAKLIGKEVKTLGIKIGDVASSPYCRCRDTAQLAFGKYRIDEDLSFSVSAQPEERLRITNSLRRMLTVAPDAGHNNIIVSHVSNLREATGVWPKPEGVAWIIQPKGDKGYQVLGKITPTDWADL
ncbi:MAG: histidine phosphatase family protein [Gammaproteobacteria bacterium]|nr:histidine phosphatase family protein [Gammaproteobacteria bacterium]